MSHAVSSTLSPTTLVSLAELGGASAVKCAAAALPARNVVTTLPSAVTDKLSTLSVTSDEGVTHARVLPHSAAYLDAWEERAAILEYDGGLPREAAERMASLLLSLSQMDSSDAEMRALDRDLLALDRLRT